LVEDEKISMGHARALLALDSPERQKKLAAEIVAKSLSVRETEIAVKRGEGESRRGNTARARLIDQERPNIVAAEAKLAKKLGAPVKIKFGRKGGVIEIAFSSTDDLTRLFDHMILKLG
jgi:ParB family chromosome partitioning protein